MKISPKNMEFFTNDGNSSLTEDFLANFNSNTNSNSHSIDNHSNNLLLLYNNNSGIHSNSNNNHNNETFYSDIYPSGYTLTQIIIASILVTILMIVIVIGNMMVIIAISTEKSLKNIQNWFIASLAVADFFLGLVIMPFSLANELMGYWIFGSWWCDIHSAMDVLLCTASINNLCLISLDRYWSITKAVEYLKTRTPARAAFMITIVWILSAVVCIPPLLGWKVERDDTDSLPQCKLSEDLGYVLYSALGSFYIPSCIMVFVYIRIYYAAKRRARRGIKKFRKSQNDQVTSFTSNSINPHNALQSGFEQQISTIETQNDPLSIPIVTCDLASDHSPNETVTDLDNQPMDNNKHTLRVNAVVTTHFHLPAELRGSTLNGSSNNKELSISPAFNRTRALSVGIDSDMISEFEPSSSDSGVARKCAVVKPRKFRLYQSIFSKPNPNEIQTKAHDLAELEPALPKPQKSRDPEKEKRRIARKKEKRATLILGLIMGSFIACWLPFFFLYILIPACKKCKIPDSGFTVAFWLGYMNSALNPAIYTIFNKDFRRAFRRILFK